MNGPILPYLLAAGPALAKSFIVEKKITMKRVIAAFLFGAVIWLMWDINVKVASAFAWVAALTSILLNGTPVIKAITQGL